MIFEQLQSISKELVAEKIQEIYEPISREMEETESRLEHFFDDEPRHLIRRASQYLPNAGGKRIRPALVLLFAKSSGQYGRDYDYPHAAAAVELIHNATLIHDDVVDDARLRRGVETLNEKWDNKTAVLVGDYLYSRALDEIERLGDNQVVGELTRATRAMSRGELISLSDQLEIEITREKYFEIIRHKTGSLMSAACFTGSSGSSRHLEESARRYGHYFGLAFQVVDDIIDLLSGSETAGKNAFKDLEKGKLTLPVIEAIQMSGNGQLNEIRSILENPMSLEDRRNRLLPIIHETNGFSRAGQYARDFARNAQEQLEPFPDNRATRSLRRMCEYVVKRNF